MFDMHLYSSVISSNFKFDFTRAKMKTGKSIFILTGFIEHSIFFQFYKRILPKLERYGFFGFLFVHFHNGIIGIRGYHRSEKTLRIRGNAL